MSEATRKLKKINIEFLSLVHKGANKKTILYKSVDQNKPNIEREITIKKVDEDQRMVYAIVYSPDEADTHGDTAEAKVIKEAAHEFMRKGITNQVDKAHDENPDEGFVAESWITKEADSVFPNDPIGSWAVGIKVENDETWDEVKKGEITGLSLQALAVVEPIKKESEPASIFTNLKKQFKDFIVELKKDFKSDLQARELENYVYALYRSNDKVLYDESITDKKAAIITNVKQFLEAFDKIEITTVTKTNKKEGDMDPKELKEAIDSAIKPLTDKIESLEKSQTETVEKLEKSSKDLADRIETVEKSTPGSKQIKKEDNSQTPTPVNIWVP